MSDLIKAIETRYDGYRFRSRLEAKWAVFFKVAGIDYQYEIEGFEMECVRYLPDFYIPSIDRWFEIKGKPLSVKEIEKCEKFCFNKDNENIKFSILIGAPELIQVDGILGVKEYTWEWPSQIYPENYRMLTDGMVEKEYYSRFLPGLWRDPEISDEVLIKAATLARQARFEFGEKPQV